MKSISILEEAMDKFPIYNSDNLMAKKIACNKRKLLVKFRKEKDPKKKMLLKEQIESIESDEFLMLKKLKLQLILNWAVLLSPILLLLVVSLPMAIVHLIWGGVITSIIMSASISAAVGGGILMLILFARQRMDTIYDIRKEIAKAETLIAEEALQEMEIFNYSENLESQGRLTLIKGRLDE